MVRTPHFIAAALLAPVLLASPARATEVEVREFACKVDGKPAGTYTITYTRQEDGSLTIAGQAEVKVKIALVTVYSYSYSGVEVWKDGRLQRLQTSCNDDGNKFTVTAASDGKQLVVKVNGKEKAVRGDVWLTTACCLPDAKMRSGAVPLLEADNGKEIDGRLEHVADEAVSAGGQEVNGARYRLTSLVPHEIWYDAAERMVRQEWVEDGHRTVLELVRVRR
jgi:hypothetical protein